MMPNLSTPAAPAPAPLDAAASDPVALGWMQGHPPPPDKRVRFADGSSYRFPQLRWSFSHYRELVPSRNVPRGAGPVAVLPRADRDDLDGVVFDTLVTRQRMSLAESLAANYTDGIVVLQCGRIVFERYFGALRPDGQHIAFSVTKSFIGLLGAMLVAEGLLDPHSEVRRIVPELGASAFGHATVRQLLDMTTGLQYSENYADPAAEVHAHVRAGSLGPRPPGYSGPDSFYEFLQTVRPQGEHGQGFAYKTVNTDALGWLIRRATGLGLAELLSQRLWQPLGCEQDAYITHDSHGTEFAGGGLNTGLRDLARFGEMMRRGGHFNGRQIVPQAVVDDIARGADPAHFAQAGYALLPGWSYRNMWWVTHNAHGAYTARGVHGQAIYVDPAAEMVIARYASHPMAANMHLDPTSLPAWHALARHLIAHPG
jgi:CubicO group peptidase (beta-lactamase class C family)